MVTWRAGTFEVLLNNYSFFLEPRPAKKGNRMHEELPEYVTTLGVTDIFTIGPAAAQEASLYNFHIEGC